MEWTGVYSERRAVRLAGPAAPEPEGSATFRDDPPLLPGSVGVSLLSRLLGWGYAQIECPPHNTNPFLPFAICPRLRRRLGRAGRHIFRTPILAHDPPAARPAFPQSAAWGQSDTGQIVAVGWLLW